MHRGVKYNHQILSFKQDLKLGRERMLKLLVACGLLKKNPGHHSMIHIYCKKFNLVPDKSDRRWRKLFVIQELHRINSPIWHGSRYKSNHFDKNGYKKPDNKQKPKEKAPFSRRAYLNYLNSKEWRTFKLSIQKQRGDKCETCGITGIQLDGHHLTYKRLFHELPEDIKILCRSCHNDIHKRQK